MGNTTAQILCVVQQQVVHIVSTGLERVKYIADYATSERYIINTMEA
jgi:hypothetical protein